jgi:asparagine synthase (glutamine-hydrolysing)
MVTKHVNVESVQIVPDENKFLDSVEKILYFQEEPFSSASIVAQWEVMKLAANNNVKVLIDGQGSDEYLGGYHHFYVTYFKQLFLNNRNDFFKEMSSYKKNIDPNFSLGGQFYLQALFPATFQRLQTIKGKTIGSEKNKILHPDFLHQYQEYQNPFNNFLSLKDATNYFTTKYGLHKLLRYADRSSMAHSIEVRLPFLNHDLVEFTHSLPANLLLKDGWSKYILRKAMEPIMPKEITWRKDKLGFQAPQTDWLKSNTIQPIMHEATQWLKSHHYLNKNYNQEYSWLNLILYLFLKK